MNYWHVFCAIFAIILGYWIPYCWICLKKNKGSSGRVGAKIPIGRRGWPFIGETLDYLASNHTSTHVAFMQKRQKLFGKVFRSNLFGRAILVAVDPEVNKVVLQNAGKVFVPFYPKSLIELMGKHSILNMDGDTHKRFHGLLSKSLKSNSLLEQTTRDVEKSMELAILGWRDKKPEVIYLQDETNKITMEILLRVLLGINPGKEMDALKKEFDEVIKGIVCIPIKFPGTQLDKSLKAKERMVKVIQGIIKGRLEERSGKDEEDFVTANVVDMLIGEFYDANDGATCDKICNMIIEMMIPGKHSVPMLMTLAIKYLTDSPSSLKQLKEENMELKWKKKQAGEGYEWLDYLSLPFTQFVINETLRMANIVHAVWRKSLEDVEIKGHLIPKGWCIMTSFSTLHFDEEIYENPFEFNPWRWQNKGATNQSTFTPFGGGQRHCPGYIVSRLEVSIFLHHFITNFSWAAEEDTIITIPTVTMKKKLPIMLSPIVT